MMKLILIDDDCLVVSALKMILEAQPDFEVAATASDGAKALSLYREHCPDVLLMDIRMPKMDGVQCTKIVKEGYPDIRIIILTTFDDDEYVYNALRFGASGYLLKGVSMDGLAEAIMTVYQGQAMINPDIATKVLRFFSQMASDQSPIHIEDRQVEELTRNEWKIIDEVAKGHSNKEISEILSLSEGTVRNYISTILDKLGLRDRTQLAIWAIQSHQKF